MQLQFALLLACVAAAAAQYASWQYRDYAAPQYHSGHRHGPLVPLNTGYGYGGGGGGKKAGKHQYIYVGTIEGVPKLPKKWYKYQQYRRPRVFVRVPYSAAAPGYPPVSHYGH